MFLQKMLQKFNLQMIFVTVEGKMNKIISSDNIVFYFFLNENFINFNHSQISEMKIVFDHLQKFIKNQNKYFESYS